MIQVRHSSPTRPTKAPAAETGAPAAPALRSPRPPAERPGTTAERVAAALAAADPAAVVVVDFDETLFLSNSTEHYLDRAGPRTPVAVLLAVVMVLRPWRWRLRPVADFAAQDAWRVGLIRRLAPGLGSRWRRDAPGVMHWLENRTLSDLLIQSRREVVVASYGLESVVAPLLAGSSVPSARLVAGPDRGLTRWRARGKAAAVADAIGDDALARAVVVTDSDRDADLLDRCAHPVLVRWPDERPHCAHASTYLPLVYHSRVKCQGKGAVVREVLLDDLPLLLIAFAWTGLLTLPALAGLVAAFFAFQCIYEIGYRENDTLDAAFSERPRLSENFFDRPDLCRDPGPRPWIWATALTAVAAALLGSATPAGPAAVFATWMALLLATRLAFAVYNRADEQTRVYLFPLLQAAKTFGYLLLLPTVAAGALLMAAQVFRRWMHYACYRAGGDGAALPSHVTRIIAFLLLTGAYAGSTGDTDVVTRAPFWCVLTWLTLRGAGQLQSTARSARWRSSRPTDA